MYNTCHGRLISTNDSVNYEDIVTLFTPVRLPDFPLHREASCRLYLESQTFSKKKLIIYLTNPPIRTRYSRLFIRFLGGAVGVGFLMELRFPLGHHR